MGENRENCIMRTNGGKKITKKYGLFDGMNLRIVMETPREVYKFSMVIITHLGLFVEFKVFTAQQLFYRNDSLIVNIQM